MRRLCFELYGKGLTTRQVGEITEKIYGAHYSSSTVSQFNQQLADQLEQWRQRRLLARYPVIYINATHAKVRREHVSSEAFYIVLGLTETMQREVLAIESIPTESAAGWERLLDGLNERGLEETELVVADALSGLDEAIHRCFLEARHQKCVTHFKRNILAYVKADHKAPIAEELQAFAEHWGRHYDHIK